MFKTAGLIPAAGSGSRLGRGPKAFLKLADKTILETVLDCFTEVDEIVVAVSEDMLLRAKEYENSRIKIIVGAQSRQATVYELLKNTDAEIVLIHDAARPFLKRQIIQKSIEAAKKQSASVVVKPLHDSIFDKKSQQSLNRDNYVAIQTPQAFRRDLILHAHENALEKSIFATDDASLVRTIGHKVVQIEGGSWLDKITTLDDYQKAIALAEIWDAA